MHLKFPMTTSGSPRLRKPQSAHTIVWALAAWLTVMANLALWRELARLGGCGDIRCLHLPEEGVRGEGFMANDSEHSPPTVRRRSLRSQWTFGPDQGAP